jgi:single-strand DNA-binding protein
MATFNRVILIGNLTRDPELRHAPTGTAVAELRLAISETFRDRRSGQPRKSVCYVDVNVWERQAENCSRFLSKGSQVLVEGRLVYDEWKTPQNETRSRLRVRADRVQFLDPPPAARREEPPGDSAAGRPSPPPPPPPSPAGEDDLPAESPGDDDDLPF